MSVEILETAKKIVDEYKQITTNSEGILTRNYFPDAVVGKVFGLHKSLWSRKFSALYPNELKFIIKYLANLSDDMLLDATLAYLRYFKTKQRNKYEKEYQMLYNYYSYINSNNTIDIDKDEDMKLYLLEVSIGSNSFYKVGTTTNISKRISNIRSSIRTNYNMVSSSVNLIDYWIEPEVDELEKKYIEMIGTNMKYHFNGSSECFDNEDLKKKIVHQMNNDYHLEW